VRPLPAWHNRQSQLQSTARPSRKGIKPILLSALISPVQARPGLVLLAKPTGTCSDLQHKDHMTCNMDNKPRHTS
jgi:hypothetical protein